MKYKNPIISGCYPDPSICRVGDNYYIVTSSFEFFPGIPVFHSTDLIHWEQIGHCITRDKQMCFDKGVMNFTGIYAPTIRYHHGIFYVISTQMTIENGGTPKNFIVWTKDPYGEWSDPIWLDTPGIDPSLFFDEDDKVYYCSSYGKIYFCEIDIKAGKRISEGSYIWEGTGGSAPEGPHIYKIDGWYYLMISEGGTEYGHMITIARSRNIIGPYEANPNNPVLTNRSKKLSLAAIGHADITQDSMGNWWGVCLGIRPISYPYRHNLGRETMLFPVCWEKDGWPIMGKDGMVEEEMAVDYLPDDIGIQGDEEKIRIKDSFDSEKLDYAWNFLYSPISELYKYGNGKGIILYGNDKSLSDSDSIAWVGRRQKHHNCTVRTAVEFVRAKEHEEAGLAVYMNNLHHYEIALTKDENENCLIFRKRIGSLWKIENKILLQNDSIYLEIQATKEYYIFRYSLDGEQFLEIGSGETQYLTTEVGGVFTGNYIAIYAVGNGEKCKHGAMFRFLEYIA